MAHFLMRLIGDCSVAIIVKMDRRPNMILIQFEIGGSIRSDCDRCLAEIDIPISGKYPLIVKFSNAVDDGIQTEDVITMHPDAPQLNDAEYIYEFVLLSIPNPRVIDCDSMKESPCDEVTKAYLLNLESSSQQSTNPVWDELQKKLN